MPRYYRPQPDYSYLLGVTLDTVLDAAIQRRGYGEGRKHYAVEANHAVLRLFGKRDWLSRQDLRQGADMARSARGWSAEFALDVIGNTIGWGLHLDLVKEEQGPDGRGYRLLEREPMYEIIAGKAVRIRGLPAAEQIAMNVRRSRLWALRATLARKRAAKVRKEASFRIDRLIAADRDAPIPEVLHAFLGEFLVGLSDEVTVRDVRELLLNAHNDWEPKMQDGWLAALSEAVYGAEHAAYTRQQAALEPAMSQEDIDAFAGI